MSSDFEREEYFAVAKTISEFDQRLLTVKSWGVSLSLVALGLGFQYRAYGFFLVAAAGSFAFWTIEAVIKRHQMRHYPRLREIEVNRYEAAGERDRARSVPRMDWSWYRAARVLQGREPHERGSVVLPMSASPAYRLSFLLPHVALPHVITFAVGIVLFVLGLFDCLRGFALGAVKG